MKTIISAIRIMLHRHRWRTTHTNRWQHPTRQQCACGMSREMEIDRGINQTGMPWEHANWIYSDGTREKYDAMG